MRPHPTPGLVAAQKRNQEWRGIFAIEVARHPPLERRAAHRSPLHQPSAHGATSQTWTADTRGTVDPASASAVAAGWPKSGTDHTPQSAGSAETEHARGVCYISTFTNAAGTGDPAPPARHTRTPGAHSDATRVVRAAGDTTPRATADRSTTAWDLPRPTATVIAARNGMKIPPPSACGQHLQRSTLRAIRRGEFINLSLLLPHPPQLDPDRTGRVPLATTDMGRQPQRRTNLQITNLDTWLQAWSRYLLATVHYHPRKAIQMIAYQDRIVAAAERYHFEGLYNYDRAFRLKLSHNPSLCWDSLDQELWALW